MTPNAQGDSSAFSLPTNNERDRSTAFSGATHAFSKASQARKPPVVGQSGANAALTAACAVRLRKGQDGKLAAVADLKSSQSRKPSVRGTGLETITGGQRQTRQIPQSQRQSLTPTTAINPTTTSPIQMTPTSLTSAPTSQRSSPLRGIEESSTRPQATEHSVGDINSLVDLFESKDKPQDSTPAVHSIRYVNNLAPLTAKPRSITPATSSVSSTAVVSRTGTTTNANPNSNDLSLGRSSFSITASDTEMRSPRATADGNESAVTSLSSVPESPLYHGPGRPNHFDGTGDGASDKPGVSAIRPPHSLNVPLEDPTETLLNDAALMLEAKTGRTLSRPVLPAWQTEPAGFSFAPGQPLKPRPAPVPVQQSRDSLDSGRSGRKSIRVSDSYVPQLSLDSLANAMVASSLASSRAPSPTKPPPLPPPRRRSKHALFPPNRAQDASRTPSPAKRMQQTMREPVKSDDEESPRKYRAHRMKHPNKYNEGDRKRYRTEVTERERKRYEGVWAANRGILLDQDSSLAVCNIVVRDIWKRSRLPNSVLEEIWDLVDSQGNCMLQRDEFVVGMFLIDQKLKGNKLPVKVSDSIWSSVRHLSGIKLPRDRP
ncbi:Increased rDNA silencing protein [Lecanora helva]